MAIILPSGNAVNGGSYVVTFCAEGSKPDDNLLSSNDVNMLTKHFTIGVDLPKLGKEDFAGLLGTGQQIAEMDIDFQNHRKDAQDYRLNVSIVWMQKLDS